MVKARRSSSLGATLLCLGLVSACSSGSSDAQAGPAALPRHTAAVDVKTPQLHGLTVQQAQAALRRTGLILGVVKRRPARRAAAKGIVLSQQPFAGILLRRGQPVSIVVSSSAASPK